MRKGHLLLYGLLLMTFSAQAQLFKGGVSLGLLASQVDGDNMEGYHKPGVFAGVYAFLPIKEGKWQLQGELDYMQKGCKAANEQGEGVLNTYHATFHQIGMPLIVQWNCLKTYRLEIGASFNMTPRISISRNGERWDATNDDTYRFFECGGVCGLHWQGDGHWGAHLRLLYSLSPAGKSLYSVHGLRHNSLLLHATYTF